MTKRVTAFFLAFALPLLAQQAPVMTLRPTVREVLLDVLVTDSRNHLVKGLKASDFHLTEDGATQTFNHFDEHDAMTPASIPPAPGLPPNTFTDFTPVTNTNASTVILLDSLDTPIDAQMYLHDQVVTFLKTVPPGIPIALFSLDTEMHLIQGFSSDPAVLLEAARSKRDQPRLSLLLSTHNEAARQFRQDALTGGMQMLARYLAGFPGRKNLVWFTGSVPRTYYEDGFGNPFSDSSSFLDDIAQTTDQLTLSRIAVYPIDARGLESDPAFSAAHTGPIPRSDRAFTTRRFYDHTDLEDVAQATGGKAFYNTNGLKQVLSEIVETGSSYYTIAYTPTNRNWDGQHRTIKVELATPGYTLQYRHGYRARSREQAEQSHSAALQRRKSNGAPNGQFANSPGNQQVDLGGGVSLRRAPRETVAASMGLGAIPPTEIVFSASITPASGITKLEKGAPLPPENYLHAPYNTRPFRNEQLRLALDPRSVQLPLSPDGLRHGRVEFIAVVYDDMGEPVNSFLSNVQLDLDDTTYRRFMKSVVTLRKTIAIPVKGSFFLRLGVHDVGSDRMGALEIPVDRIQLGLAGAGQTLNP